MAKVETALQAKRHNPAKGLFVMAGVPVTMINAQRPQMTMPTLFVWPPAMLMPRWVSGRNLRPGLVLFDNLSDLFHAESILTGQPSNAFLD